MGIVMSEICQGFTKICRVGMEYHDRDSHEDDTWWINTIYVAVMHVA